MEAGAPNSVFQPQRAVRAPATFTAPASRPPALERQRSNSLRLAPRTRGIWTPNSTWQPRSTTANDEESLKVSSKPDEPLLLITDHEPEKNFTEDNFLEGSPSSGPPLPTGSAILYEDFPTLKRLDIPFSESNGTVLLHSPNRVAPSNHGSVRDWAVLSGQFRTMLNSGQTWIPPRITLVTRYLLLGGFDAAGDVALLRSLQATHVLNAAGNQTPAALRQRESSNFIYLEMPADDSPAYDISQHFTRAHSFIEQARISGGRVLVHCMAGINRSAALVLSHLLLAGHDLLAATAALRSSRGMFLVNPSFQQQVLDFAKHLHNEKALSS